MPTRLIKLAKSKLKELVLFSNIISMFSQSQQGY